MRPTGTGIPGSIRYLPLQMTRWLSDRTLVYNDAGGIRAVNRVSKEVWEVLSPTQQGEELLWKRS